MRIGVCLALLLPCLAQAQIYRWVDEQGRVHFAQHPQAQAEEIEVRAQVVERDPQTREREERAKRFFDARRDERIQQQTEQHNQRAEQQERCAAAKMGLARLSAGGVYFRQQENGERDYYSEEQVQAARRQWQAQVDRYCP